jgi:site-specific DNA recombinase
VQLIGYTRVSRVGKREGDSFLSPDLQREAIEAYAKAHGHRIVYWLEDLDESGSKLSRPAMKKALSALREGQTDGLIAAKLDRFTRRVGDLGRLLDEAKAGGWNLIAVDLGLDFSTLNGRLVANVLGAVAEWELMRRSEDWAAVHARKIDEGVHFSGRVPTAYKRSVVGTRKDGKPQHGPLVLDPEVATHVRECFLMRAQGASWRELSNLLNEHGVRTSYGSKWSYRAVRSILRSRTYVGEARHGDKVKEGAHPAIVSEGEWQAAQRKQERAVTRGEKSEGGLLSGLLVCSGCGHRMTRDFTVRKNGNRTYFYRCRNNGACDSRASISASKIEPYVNALMIAILESGELTVEPRTDETDEIDAAVAKARADLQAWDDAFDADSDPAAFRAGREKRKAAVIEAEAMLADARALTAESDALSLFVGVRDLWNAPFPLADKRRAISALLPRVQITKGSGPIEHRVSFLSGTEELGPALPAEEAPLEALNA